MASKTLGRPSWKIVRWVPYPRVTGLALGTLLTLAALSAGVLHSAGPGVQQDFLTAAVYRGALAQTVLASGEVMPAATVAVVVPAGAGAASMSVDAGQHVAKGAVLAHFNGSALQVAVSGNQALVLADQQQLNLLSSALYQSGQSASLVAAQDALAAANAAVEEDQGLGNVVAQAGGTVEDLATVGAASVPGQPLAVISGKAVRADESGTVQSVAVHAGADVAAGAVLMRVSSPALSAKLLSAESQAASASAQVDKLEEQDSADPVSVAQARAALQRAQQDLTQSQQALSQLAVTAPFPGEVAAVNASAKPGQTLLTLDSLALNVHIPVPATQIGSVKVGQAVEVAVAGVGGRAIHGRVQAIAPQATYSNGLSTFLVTVSLPAKRDIRYGMSANLSVVVRRVRGALLVPLAALHNSGTRMYVERVGAHGHIYETPVRVLLETSSMAAVRSTTLPDHSHVITADIASHPSFRAY